MPKRKYTLKTRKNKQGEWRWKIVAANGENVASGGEGFKRRPTMLRTLKHLAEWIKTL